MDKYTNQMLLIKQGEIRNGCSVLSDVSKLKPKPESIPENISGLKTANHKQPTRLPKALPV